MDTCKVMTLQQLWRLKTIFYKYGHDITDFTWESCKMTKSEIVTLLNFMPGLKSLTVIAWKLQEELYDELTPLLNLKDLVNLKITRSDPSTVNFFTNFLPPNTITDLNLQNDPEGFLSVQQSIKKLELHVDLFNHEDLKAMQLSELKLKLRRYRDEAGESVVQSIVAYQPQLKSLNLIGCEGCFDGDDAAFSAICSLQNLETLRLNIDDLSSTAFVEHFGKLSRLRSLEVESVEHNFTPVITIVEELSRQKMEHLESLKVYLNDVGFPLDRIETMGLKFHSLKCLTIRCDHPLPLDAYLSNLKHLESLDIDYHYTKEFSKFCTNFDFVCSNIKHLTLQGFGFGSDDVNWNELTLLKLTDVVPNLEKLELDAAFPFNTEFIIKILEKLKKIKVLRHWSMVQSGENYNKFDFQSVVNLGQIANTLSQFSLELRLKAIDMDVSRVKDDLSKDFYVTMTRLGNFIVFRLEKK